MKVLDNKLSEYDLVDKNRVKKILNSIDKNGAYGIIYKELRDLEIKMINGDK